MEVWQEHSGVVRRPKWCYYRNVGGLKFEESVILDANLGAHMGGVGFISRTDQPDFLAKNWDGNTHNAMEATIMYCT